MSSRRDVKPRRAVARRDGVAAVAVVRTMRVICEKMRTRWPPSKSLRSSLSRSTILPECFTSLSIRRGTTTG